MHRWGSGTLLAHCTHLCRVVVSRRPSSFRRNHDPEQDWLMGLTLLCHFSWLSDGSLCRILKPQPYLVGERLPWVREGSGKTSTTHRGCRLFSSLLAVAKSSVFHVLILSRCWINNNHSKSLSHGKYFFICYPTFVFIM